MDETGARFQVDELKRQAAAAAVSLVESSMVVGLGAGSTARMALEILARRLHRGELRDVRGVPCAEQVAADARRLGIPLTTLEEHPTIDLTIDGADEVDPRARLIKGGGGALLREKIVAQASCREVIIVDETKLSPVLGTRWPLPVEVLPFGWRTHLAFLQELGATPTLRTQENGMPFRTDQGNYILDCAFGPIRDPEALAQALAGRAGVVGHGLFLDLVTDLIVATQAGLEHRMV